MSTHAVQDVPVEALIVRKQVRESIEEEGLAELAQSIREHGILQTLLAHREGSRLVLDDGHRRLAAAKRLGLATVPVVVDPRQLETTEITQRQMVVNVQRVDLSAIDKARALRQLMGATNWTATETAHKLGMSGPTVSRLLKLLELPESVQEKIAAKTISASAAYEIAQADGAAAQEQLADAAAADKLNRDEVARKRRGDDAGFTVKGGPKASGRVPLKLSGGRTIVASGPKLSSITDLIAWLDELLAHAKRVKNRGVELATFVRLLADQAKAEPETKP